MQQEGCVIRRGVGEAGLVAPWLVATGLRTRQQKLIILLPQILALDPCEGCGGKGLGCPIVCASPDSETRVSRRGQKQQQHLKIIWGRDSGTCSQRYRSRRLQSVLCSPSCSFSSAAYGLDSDRVFFFGGGSPVGQIIHYTEYVITCEITLVFQGCDPSCVRNWACKCRLCLPLRDQSENKAG